MPPAAAKKNPSFGDLSNQSKKRNLSKERRGSGRVPGSKKNLKVPPLFGWFRHHNNNIYPIFLERRRRRRPRLRGGRARVGQTLPRTQPPRVFFFRSFARARAEERERERERKKKSASLRIEKEKRGKEGSDETTRGGAHPRIARAS